MAVVFISPKQRQKMFIIGITVSLGLILLIIAAIVLFSKPSEKQISQEMIFNKPKININFEVLESEQFKNLHEFKEMELRFSYKAFDKDDKEIDGFIAAVSIEDATKKLTDLGYTVSDIKEVEIGRENPFEVYENNSESFFQELSQ